ncbi:MAG: ABC transporter ATP-binding protein [Planctomycetota bacterium]
MTEGTDVDLEFEDFDEEDAVPFEVEVAVELSGLSKTFGDKKAVDELSLEVACGEVIGFVGSNGAGKTTTFRILAGLLAPSGGRAKVLGMNVRTDERFIRKAVGYMPESFGVYDNMSLQEYLDFFAAAYRMERSERKSTIDAVLELTDLSPLADDLVSGFSRGMQQRACLAKTLLHDPEVLLLDEPASGLDPRARVEFREIIGELQNMGKTILISSHVLSELASVCTRVAILEAGKLVALDSVAELIHRAYPTRRFNARFLDEAAAKTAAREIQNDSRIVDVQPEDRSVQFAAEFSDADVSKLLAGWVSRGVALVTLEETQSDLESVFLSLTRGEIQ